MERAPSRCAFSFYRYINMSISQRLQNVQDPVIPIVADKIRQTPGCISLGQGISHWSAPQEVYQAIQELGASQQLDRYGVARGNDELHQAIREKTARDNQYSISDDQRILVCAGSNMGFFQTVSAVCDPGDEVILPAPYYFNHEMAIRIAGCTPVIVPCHDNYQLDLQRISDAITERTRLIVSISPNNPSGAVYPLEDLRALNALCAKHNCYHFSDEAYEYFCYDGEHASPMQLADSASHTIASYSLSKSYGMAGWRCAWLVYPQQLESALIKIQDTNLICPPQISQTAALAALQVGSDWVRERVDTLVPVRSSVLEQLHSISDIADVSDASGAFYVILRLKKQLQDMTVVDQLISEHKVAVLPGSTFGLDQACSLRLAFGALDAESVDAGIKRLTNGLRQICT